MYIYRYRYIYITYYILCIFFTARSFEICAIYIYLFNIRLKLCNIVTIYESPDFTLNNIQ